MKTFIEFINENTGTESYKNMIIDSFPEYKNPEFINKGFFGEAYIVEKDNQLYI